MTATEVSAQAVPPVVMIFGAPASGGRVLGCALALWATAEAADAGAAVTELDQRALRWLGVSENDPRPVWVRAESLEAGRAMARSLVVREFLEPAKDVLRAGLSSGTPFVLDDPALCLLRPLWEAALAALELPGLSVLVVRNPIEVAASLKQRRNLPAPIGQQLWLRYNLAALTEGSGGFAHVVSFDEVLAERAHLIRRLAGADAAPEGAARVEAFIDPGRRNHTVGAGAIERSPMLSTLTRGAHALLAGWEEQEVPARRQAAKAMAAAYDDALLLFGRVATLTPPPPAAAVPPVEADGRLRHVLVHYHLFKNAGTSVDAVLKKSFGAAWLSREFTSADPTRHAAELTGLLRDDHEVLAVSSHTLLPLPAIPGIALLPVVFVRHPLDRLRSAYQFERTQNAETTGSRLAREMDFADYVRARLGNSHDRSCRDFQAFRLAAMLAEPGGSEEERAVAALERLPFIGLVEAFDLSMARLGRVASPLFPTFQPFTVRMNVSQPPRDMRDRLAEIRSMLGDGLYAQVVEANALDLRLYERVHGSYSRH